MMRNLSIKQNEQGNALFLILIAVVLFAALSYAITQSNRGGGSANRETSLISSTTITQYSSAMRTGVMRMLLRNVDMNDIDFTPPVAATYNALASDPATSTKLVFHPDGGGASYALVDGNTVGTVFSGGLGVRQNGNWFFTRGPVNGIGTSENDLVAVLSEIRPALCERINEQITGSKTIPVVAASISDIANTGGTNTSLSAETVVAGQSFMCIQSSGGEHAYYHVLAEQ